MLNQVRIFRANVVPTRLIWGGGMETENSFLISEGF